MTANCVTAAAVTAAGCHSGPAARAGWLTARAIATAAARLCACVSVGGLCRACVVSHSLDLDADCVSLFSQGQSGPCFDIALRSC